MNTPSFSSLALSPGFLANLTSLNYERMTPVQAQSLPAIMAGRDVKAQAKTGSGKTAAFGIGLLNKLQPENFKTQALIVCPTRELADQVANELRRLARPIPNTKILTLCGGKPLGPQFASLEHPPHVAVGTPGRLLKHIEKGSLRLDGIATLVLDEADRMLDMGFLDDIRFIIEQTPRDRQTLLFSATYPAEIESISRSVQNDPLTVEVESLHDSSTIRQEFYETQGEKIKALTALLQQYQPTSSVVFCNRKDQCQSVYQSLKRQGYHVLALEGDMDQKARDEALVRFSNKSISLLIATDVAARGLDIKDLDIVFNYELSPDPEVHVHRIGRTGRAGSTDLAISIFTPSEVRKVLAIEGYLKTTAETKSIAPESTEEKKIVSPPMVTFMLDSGRKNKLRPGDILGALTANKTLSGDDIGKIDIFDFVAYVAVKREVADQAFRVLSKDKVKGMMMKVRRL